jgi:3-hydroxyacyl-CoA dehydrogenase
MQMQERCQATKDVIRDLELMAQADYFIGSSTSGIPPFVAALRIALYQKAQVG